jgi:hypothetical protein
MFLCPEQFHPTEANTVVSVDDMSRAHVWRGDTARRYRDFRLIDTRSTSVRASSVLWVNEQVSPLLAVGCNDGVVKLWSGVVDDDVEPKQVAGFVGLPEVVMDDRGSGLVLQVAVLSVSVAVAVVVAVDVAIVALSMQCAVIYVVMLA